MSRLFQVFSALVITLLCISGLAGCGSESSAVDQADGGLPDGGAGAGGAGAGGAGGTGGAGAGGAGAGGAGAGGTGAGGASGAGGAAGAGGAGGANRFHPANYALPEAHGYDMQLQQSDCRNCHAADLTGSLGPSCDTCHTAGWRTDCVFCHGGIDNDLLGSPPRDLAGVVANISFPGHTPHVMVGIAGGFDCVQCHIKAVDVLSPEHAFDDTKGVAEVDLAGGLSPQGTYASGVGCQSLYCHGDGQGDDGTVAADALPMTCESCHAGMGSSESAWESMSGEHRKHLKENFDCGECHTNVTSDGMSIRAPLLHVDGANQVHLADTGINYVQGTGRCSGSCHGENHQSEGW